MTFNKPSQLVDLQQLCTTNTEESLILEFKSCNEIRINSTFFDKKKKEDSIRTKEDIVDELSRDVSAFLNSAGGIIIYGIKEKNSRARSIDRSNAFTSGENITSEVIVQWIRAYVQPSPSVNVYRIFEDPDNSQSSWYLVVEVPQGLQAYMARDHRFYKRVGNIVQPMEQYEVSDVMNRMRGASLTLQMNTVSSQRSLREERITIPINVAITSSNFVSSEYGALKFIIAWPATFPEGTEVIFGRVSRDTGLSLEGYSDTPSAESMFLRWGANMGTVIFPESWHDFNRNAIRIAVPNPSLVPNPTYLVFTELFTINSQSKKALYALKQKGDSIDFEIIEVRTEDYSSIVADYWHSFHQAYRSGFSTS